MIIPKHVRGSHTGWRDINKHTGSLCLFTLNKNFLKVYGAFLSEKKQQFFVGLKFALIYSVPIFFIGDKTDKFK